MKNLVEDPNDPSGKAPHPLGKTSIDFQVAKTFIVFALLLVSMSMSSCAAVGGIFKAGVAAGIFLVVVIIAVIVAIAMRAGGKK